MYKDILDFIRGIYQSEDFIPLHQPCFDGKESEYVQDAINSTFVSSVGEYVNKFEVLLAEITGARYAIATVNGTAALHTALILTGVEKDHEVITQPLTFVATANAIRYVGANPVFVDVDKENLSLCPDSLLNFLGNNTKANGENCINKITGKKISACVPMHTFGFPAKIDAIVAICNEFGIPVIEDAAESLGSRYKNQHTGTFGTMGTFSFNGNKIVTSGGGGAIITDDENLARLAKHITTTAKAPHKWEYYHDMLGFNYRMPNLNAAIACAQLEQLNKFVENKRKLAECYSKFFAQKDLTYVNEQRNTLANYWLNTIIFNTEKERGGFLKESNENRIMTRPVWQLINKLPMYNNCLVFNTENANWLEKRIVNIPSSVTIR